MSNETTNKKKYYKILPEDLTCHGFKYQLGLNIDINEFDSTPCKNGLHFSDTKNILTWLDLYENNGKCLVLKIATLYVPDEYEIIKFSNKYKSHAIYIEEIRDLLDKDTIDWMVNEGINIHANHEYLLQLATINDKLDIIKYLVEEQDANIHANNEYALRLACINGNLDIVKYLVEYGADIYVNNDYILKLALIYNHLDVVKYLQSLKK